MLGERIVACVKWGDMYPACYANILYAMVKRNLPAGFTFRFACFTDDGAGLAKDIEVRPLPGDLEGWWNKLSLFKPGTFAPGSRILYFDLDTLITGPLDAFFACTADFALLRDFYRPGGYGSGVMLWRSGACDVIWTAYQEAGKPVIAGGDQAWIERMYPNAGLLQDIQPGCIASFKTDCKPFPPPGTRVVAFHGEPKQDNCGEPWVAEIWRAEDAMRPSKPMESRQQQDARRLHHARTVPCQWLAPQQAHARQAIIAGNGPSLLKTLPDISDGDIIAAGAAGIRLEREHIPFSAHVLKHGDTERMPRADVQRYYAATLPADVYRGRLTLWNPLEAQYRALSTGLCALRIAFLLGYRVMHLAGFDGCMPDGKRQYEAQRLLRLTLDGKKFTVSAAQQAQARQFALLADELVRQGCMLHVYGEGLIPFISRKLIDGNDRL